MQRHRPKERCGIGLQAERGGTAFVFPKRANPNMAELRDHCAMVAADLTEDRQGRKHSGDASQRL